MLSSIERLVTSVMNFWEDLASAGINLQDFVKHALCMIGYDNAFIFMRMDTEQRQDAVIQELRNAIILIAQSSVAVDPNIKNSAYDHIKMVSSDFNSYQIPLGIKHLILEIRNICLKAANNSDRSQQRNETLRTEDSLTSYSEKALHVFNSAIPEDLRRNITSISIRVINDVIYAFCPFDDCIGRFNIIETKRKVLNLTNFKRHIRACSRSDNGSDDESYQESESSCELSSSSSESSAVEDEEISDENQVNRVINQPALVDQTVQVQNPRTSSSVHDVQSQRLTRSIQQDDDYITNFLSTCVESAKNIIEGWKGNRYDSDIKNLAGYLLARNGRSEYKFFQKNLKFPDSSTIQKYMKKKVKPINEAVLYFDELQNYLNHKNYTKEVSLIEDATKITEIIEYIKEGNLLSGLVSPIDSVTGMPTPNFFKADTAKNIFDLVQKYERASYVQILLAQPNNTGAKPFLLSIAGTSNSFKKEDIINRYSYIFNELKKRGIRMLCFSTDGDSKYLSAQKRVIDFGNFCQFGDMLLAGSLESDFFGLQDGYHIAKKLKNAFYDTTDMLRMGDYHVSINHLIIMAKKFSKELHGLEATDLNQQNKMDYKCIHKITKPNILELMKELIQTNGTICYLELISYVLKAFVDLDTTVKDRIFYASYCVEFFRIWRQWISDHGFTMTHFTSLNSWHGLEINLIFLIKLALECRAQDFSELSSQKCENYFRLIRSFTGCESTVINVSMKSLISRIHHIDFCEYVMNELQEKFYFPKQEKRSTHQQKHIEILSAREIIDVISEAKELAKNKARSLNMTCDEFRAAFFLKPVSVNEDLLVDLDNQDSGDVEDAEEDEPNIFGIDNNLPIQISSDEDDPSELTADESLLSNIYSGKDELIVYNNPKKIMKKSAFLRLIQSKKSRISIDIHNRFISRVDPSITPLTQINELIHVENKITKGDFIIMYGEDWTGLFFGCVLSFQYMNEGRSSKKQRNFPRDTLEMNLTTRKVGILLNPKYKIRNGTKHLLKISNHHIDSDHYIAHANENVVFSNQHVKEKLNSLLRRN